MFGLPRCEADPSTVFDKAILFALLIRIAIALPLVLYPERALEPDSAGYLGQAVTFATAWSLSSPPITDCSGFFALPHGGGPGFGFFLGILGRFAIPVQILLSISWIGPVGRMVTRRYGPRAGRVSAWLAALDPLQAMLASLYLTESLSASALAWAVVAVERCSFLSAAYFVSAAFVRISLWPIALVNMVWRRSIPVVAMTLLPLAAWILLSAGSSTDRPLFERISDYLLWNVTVIEIDGRDDELSRSFEERKKEIRIEDRATWALNFFSTHPGRTSKRVMTRLPALLFGASSASFAARFGLEESAVAVLCFRIWALVHAGILWVLALSAVRASPHTHLEGCIRILLVLLPAIGPATYGRFRAPIAVDLTILAGAGARKNS